jgi:hypothetical protein
VNRKDPREGRIVDENGTTEADTLENVKVQTGIKETSQVIKRDDGF